MDDLGPEIGRLIGESGYGPGEAVVVGLDTGLVTTVATDPGLGAGTLAYTASLSKQVVGACVALLARDARLGLDDPLARWLPELPGWATRVRLSHLLAHTGGLPPEHLVRRRMAAAGERDWTTPGVLGALTAFPGAGEPGLGHDYCNLGYICLGEVVARAAREPLPRFARRELFAPLGMDATLFWPGPAPAPPGASPFPDRPAPLSLGDGGMWSTVSDLLRWNRGLHADALGIAAALHRTGSLGDGTTVPYAMGVAIRIHRGRTVHSHGGAWPGLTAKLIRVPDTGHSLAVLARADGLDRMVALGDALTDLLVNG